MTSKNAQDRETYDNFLDEIGEEGQVSSAFKDFILKMLDANPQKRLTDISLIQAHPWYSGPTSTHQEAILEMNALLRKAQA